MSVHSSKSKVSVCGLFISRVLSQGDRPHAHAHTQHLLTRRMELVDLQKREGLVLSVKLARLNDSRRVDMFVAIVLAPKVSPFFPPFARGR